MIPAPEPVAAALDLPLRTQVLHLSRTRTANGRPVIHCEEYLPASQADVNALSRQAGQWSLYESLSQAGTPVTSAVCKVASVVADATLAQRLRVPTGHPLLLLRQTHFGPDHRPVLYCENYHNSAVIEFHILRRC